MADGDTKPSLSPGLTNRGNNGRRSYFFDLQVMLCRSEQFKLVSSLLAQKEKEAQITFKKPFSDQIGIKPQIDNVFVNLILDSDVPVNLDSLIDDLRLLANSNQGGGDLTRLLDLLFVSRKVPLLLEELDIRKVSYDLYDPEARGRLDPLVTYSKRAAETPCEVHSNAMALAFAMLATGQDEVVAAALVNLASALSCPWDALILSRYVFGQDNEVTKSIHTIWTEFVKKDDQFRVIKTVLALKNGHPKDLARELIAGVTNKENDPTEMFNAYRCLAIALHNSNSLPEVERNLEVADTCKTMRAIYVTLLGWGKLNWARVLVDDLSSRASPGGIPSYICKIALNCHIELVEYLLNVQANEGFSSTNGSLSLLGQKWRAEINREHGEMSKLKTDTPGFQMVVYEWLTQLATVMRAPLVETPNLSAKMECVYLAFEFLHTLLRWAAAGGEEPLRLLWPEKSFSFSVKDEVIVYPELLAGVRSRTMSAGSSRSAATSKDDGKKQKKKVEKKEEPSAVPLHEPIRIIDSHQQKDRKMEQHTIRKGLTCHNCRQEGHFANDCQNPPVTLPSQDIRAISHGQHGRHAPVAPIPVNSFPRESPTVRAPGRHNRAPFDPNLPPPSSIPRSAPSSSDNDLNKIDQHPSPSISETAIADSSKNNQPAAVHLETNARPKSPRVPNPDLTQEEISATFVKSLMRHDISTESKEENKSGSEQQPSASSALHHVPQKPSMGTAAANEARELRSLENTQTVEKMYEECDREIQKVEQPGQEPDKQFQELTKQIESKEDHDNISPDPSEMHKLFTGNSKGQGTLPRGMQDDHGSTTLLPPVPTHVAAADSSLNRTQLRSSDEIVVPQVSETANQTYPSSSNEVVLTPITEASQETFGTKSTAISESDTHGLHNESMDSVFEEDVHTNQTTPIHVDVSQLQQVESPDQSTPRAEDLSFPSCSQSPSEVEPREVDNRTAFPHLSPMHTETSATVSSDVITEVPATSQMMGVRREAEDMNQVPVMAPHSQQRNIADFVPKVNESDTAAVHISRTTGDMTQSEQAPAVVITQQETAHQLDATCAEPEVKELVTSCGVSYKFSPTKEQEVPIGSSNGNMSDIHQSVQDQDQSNVLDSFLSKIGTADNATGVANQDGHHTNLNSDWITQPAGANSTTNVHTDAHSTAQLQEASKERDYARENGVTLMHAEAHSIPSVPSTVRTTSEPNFYEQPQVSEHNEWITDNSSKPQTGPDSCAQPSPQLYQAGDYNPQFVQPVPSNVGSIPEQQQHPPNQTLQPPQPASAEHNEWIVNDCSQQQTGPNSWAQPTSQQYQSGDYNSQLTQSIPSNMGSIPEQQQQQQPNQMLQPPQTSIPTYIDPFDTQQQLNAPKNSPQVQQQSFGGNAQEAPPCFGTGNSAQNAQQHFGFTPSNPSHGLNQGNQNNFHQSNRGGQEFRRGGRGGDRYRGNARGAHSGGSGFGGFSGAQDVRAGNQQQKTGFGHNASGFAQSGSGFGSGDNGQQRGNAPRPNRGNSEHVRGGTGGRGAPSARGFSS